jgi:hypothetical protein
VAPSEKGNFSNHAGGIFDFTSAGNNLAVTDEGNQKVIHSDLITFLKGNFSNALIASISATYKAR